jgi:hypothetical protein
VQGKQVRLSWEKSPSSGMIQYIVVRKQSEPPLSPFDGEVLYEGASNSYVDKSLRPLIECYYCVYARRGSTCSATGTLAQHTVLLVPEVENLRILPTNGGAQLGGDGDAAFVIQRIGVFACHLPHLTLLFNIS